MAQFISLVKHTSSLNPTIVEWFGLKADDPSGKIVPVVWLDYTVIEGKVYLYTIETREGYRNRGYATHALNLLKEAYNVPEILHDGSYTPEGFNYIRSKLNWLPSGGEQEAKIGFRSMNFVENWEVYQNHTR